MSENVDTLMRDLEQELGVRGPAAVLRAALKIAKEAAAEAKQSQPPAPPAWMVEVAREVCARRCERAGLHAAAAEYRAGRADEAEIATIVAALQLALSRGHVVVPRPMPSEEEMLKGAWEDAAQAYRDARMPIYEAEARSGKRDAALSVRAALQARRNVYASLGAVAGKAVSSGPVVPEVDVRRALKKAWADGFDTAGIALEKLSSGEGDATTLYDNEREMDVSAILENFKSGEA